MGRRGRGDCNMGGSGGLQEATYAVPADKCGLVIGKGEENCLCFPVSVLSTQLSPFLYIYIYLNFPNCTYDRSSDIVTLIWLWIKYKHERPTIRYSPQQIFFSISITECAFALPPLRETDEKKVGGGDEWPPSYSPSRAHVYSTSGIHWLH